MSPSAPALTAHIGPSCCLGTRLAIPTKIISSVATGVDLQPPAAALPPPGMGPSCWVRSSQSTLPEAGSYERMRLGPITTSSVRTLFRQITGVLQVELSDRLARHSSLPVFLSSAMRNDFSR